MNISLADVLAAFIRPIVREELRAALILNSRDAAQSVSDKSFLTVKQVTEVSGLGASTIRLAIRRRQIRAQKVGRRVLTKRSYLESFLEANPIAAIPR